ncbi:unnamed protein product [Closterium sp. NIES-64]|nr:unnamed protein product [Closterium sp. NIES-64]
MVDYWLAGHSVDDHPHSRSCGRLDGAGGVEVLLSSPPRCWWGGGTPARVLLSSPFPPGVCAFPPGVCAFPPGVCAFLPRVRSPLAPSRPLLPFVPPRRQDGGGGVEVLLLKHQNGGGGVEDAKTVVVGWRYSRWSTRVRTWPAPRVVTGDILG